MSRVTHFQCLWPVVEVAGAAQSLLRENVQGNERGNERETEEVEGSVRTLSELAVDGLRPQVVLVGLLPSSILEGSFDLHVVAFPAVGL